MDILSNFALIYFIGALLFAIILTFTKVGPGPIWFFRFKLWVRLVLAASMVVSAIVGIYGFARKAERAELTFEPGSDYVWPSVPLRVYTPPGDGYLEEVETAVKIWNRSVGCDLFMQEGTAAAAQVRVRAFDGAPCGKEWRNLHGSEAPNRPEGTWDCKDGTNEILLNNPGDFETGARSVLHGLGHSLRLAHDASGIMAPEIQSMTVLLPNDKDVAALRSRYCQQLR